MMKLECEGIHWYNFKEEITAETVVAIPRVELIDKVHSVEKVNHVRKVEAERKNGSGSNFDQMLAFEQNKNRNRARSLEEMPVAINPDVMAGKMNYYNNRAMEAYFCMTFSTTDLRG